MAQWQQLIIDTQAPFAEQFSEQLEALGASSVTFQNQQDEQPLFELKPNDSPLWDKVSVVGLFTQESNLTAILEELHQTLPEQAWLNQRIEPLEDKNWNLAWMDHFEPLRFGHQLWVCPSWKPCPDPQAVSILLDPGMAFGTGYHATTALILEWLTQQNLKHKTVVDYGCGSGILGIAALKLGAKHVMAVDIDPIALETTLDNAQKNHLNLEQLSTYLPEDCPDYPCDIVFANILAEPLHDLFPVLNHLVKPQALLLLSGIMRNQVDSLMACYSSSFIFEQPIFKEEWALLIGKHN